MKKILITGATGYIGNKIITLLLNENYNIVATSTNRIKAQEYDWFNKVQYITFNFNDSFNDVNLYEFFGQPDMLIHLAWEGLPNYNERFHLDNQYPKQLLFLQNFLDNKLTNLTITGTCLEYGLIEGEISETLKAEPTTFYGKAKLQLYNDLQKYISTTHKNVNLKWLRLFYNYDYVQNTHSIISAINRAVKNGDTIFNMSKGDQLRDYLPIDKMAHFIIQTALQNQINGIINICSGEPIKLETFIKNYLNEMGFEITLNLGYYPYNNYEPKNFWGNNSKLLKILNFKK